MDCAAYPEIPVWLLLLHAARPRLEMCRCCVSGWTLHGCKFSSGAHAILNMDRYFSRTIYTKKHQQRSPRNGSWLKPQDLGTKVSTPKGFESLGLRLCHRCESHLAQSKVVSALCMCVWWITKGSGFLGGGTRHRSLDSKPLADGAPSGSGRGRSSVQVRSRVKLGEPC